MPESTVLEDIQTGKNDRQARYFKAKVLNTHQSNEVNDVIDKAIDEKSIVFTYQSTSYMDIADFDELIRH